jgi:hypothetical protein
MLLQLAIEGSRSLGRNEYICVLAAEHLRQRKGKAKDAFGSRQSVFLEGVAERSRGCHGGQGASGEQGRVGQ